MKFDCEYVGTVFKPDWNNQTVNQYLVTLTEGDISETFDYFQGMGIKDDPKEADVMECLILDALTYLDHDAFSFMEEFGYDDTKSARKAYNGCGEAFHKLENIMSVEDMREYLENCNNSLM